MMLKGTLNFYEDYPISKIAELREYLRKRPIKIASTLEGIIFDSEVGIYDLERLIKDMAFDGYLFKGTLLEINYAGDVIRTIRIAGTEIEFSEAEYDDTIKNCIVVNDAWEYNDEYYYQPEGEPFSLKDTVLYTEKHAMKIRDELNEKYGFEGYDENYSTIDIKPYRVIKLKID